ncbi:uncharacterized protein [Nicotiana sylvestris]|uniref:uncharacterized protein n=1 Tax=Nicotiana sylvestris TaxID=4096 RepID=UPI00388CCC3F
MAVELKASKPGVADVVPPRAEEALEGDVSEPIDGKNISRAEGRSDIALYNRGLAKSQAESTRYAKECERLSSEAGELRALFTKKGEKLNNLRARFETVSRERTDLAEQLEKKDVLMREGLRARDIDILKLKQCVDEIASERDTLQGKLTSVERCLQDTRADGGIDLSAEIERVKALKEESATLLSSDDGSASGLASGFEEDEGEGEVLEEEAVDVLRVQG